MIEKIGEIYGTEREVYKKLEDKIDEIIDYLNNSEVFGHTLAKYSYPNNGYLSDQKLAKEHLEIGKIYSIKKIDVGDFSTKVWLRDFPEIYFNSVLFEIS